MKKYEKPQWKLLVFSTDDVVRTSGNEWDDPKTKDDGSDYPWFNTGL